MGRRMYPNTTDTRQLEKMANVPVGTAAKLALLEHECGAESDKLMETLYDGKHEDENNYHGFLLYGFGKFIGLPGDNYAGEAEGAEAQRLLALNEIPWTLEECGGGIHWS